MPGPKPLFRAEMFCVRPYRRKQNPYTVAVSVWPSRAKGDEHMKTFDSRWGRSAVAYFCTTVEDTSTHIGEIMLLKRHISLESLTHECAHAAHEFSRRHAFKEIEHCPYLIGQDAEECIAYVTGHLVMKIFLHLPADLQAEAMMREAFL